MFNLKVVQNCPVTRASQGRVTMPPWLLAELVGTLDREKGQEWLILLHGERSKDGLDVKITGASVPADQIRHGTRVTIPERVMDDDIVAALHSHNEMSAVFSGTDYGDINQRFAVSIVISSRVHTDEDKWLGFSYQAEGRVTLPCGSLGVVDFKLAPEGVEDWPLKVESYFGVDEDTSLGDCNNVLYGKGTRGNFHQSMWPKCEQIPTEQVPKYAVFGAGEGEMASMLPPPTQPVIHYSGWKGHNNEEVAKAYVDAEFEEEVAHTKGLECECCGNQTGKYKLIGKDLICRDCEKFWLESEAADMQPLSDAAWISDWDEDRAWRERWAEVGERGGC